MTVKQISCDLHDYFEIVCMRNSHVEVVCLNGDKFIGTAITITKQSAQEALQLRLADETLINILLTNISQLVATNNPIDGHNFKLKL